MEHLRQAKTLYQNLRQEFDKSNYQACGDLLSKLKVVLTKLRFLPTSGDVTEEELFIARSVLEIGAEWSIAVRDIPSFERYMCQLKCYYLDHKDKLPESTAMYSLLGLNLLYLLSQNRVAEFHTELELLPIDIVKNNVYIKHPVSLEQNLIEGCYTKIYLAAHITPAPTYNFFMNILLGTIRNELADCLEKAYVEITDADAHKMLNLEKVEDLKKFIADRGWKKNAQGRYTFNNRMNKAASDDEKPYLNVAQNMLQYAKEMEMIV